MATRIAAAGMATPAWRSAVRAMKPVSLFIEMAQTSKAPFFLWYAPMMPHQPHNPPERLLAHYRDKAPSPQVARYWAMCEWFDETCGELLDFLDTQKIADNTLVIFLADNGWIQDPQADRYAPRSKQSPYEGGLRTPILVRWPGKVAPRTCDTPVSLDRYRSHDPQGGRSGAPARHGGHQPSR